MSFSWPSWWTNPKTRLRVLLTATLSIAILWLIVAAWRALIPFMLGLLLSYLLLPLVNYLDVHAPPLLKRWRWSRPVAILVVYAIVGGLIAGMITMFIPTIGEQARYLADALPDLLTRLEGLLSHDLVDLLDRVPPQIADWVNANLEKAGAAVLDAVQRGLGATLRTLFQTLSFVLGMIIVPFWTFYVLNNESKVIRAFYGLIPKSMRQDVHCILRIIDRLASAYLRGQFLLCVAVGAMATIALVVFDIRGALFLGTLAGILEIIPYLGPWLGGVLPVIIALADSPMKALWVAVTFAGIQQVENVFLVPRITGNATRFHPAVVMIIVVVGAEIGGVWGVLLAAPLLAIVRDVFRYLYLRTTERGATPEMAMEILRVSSL